MGWLAVVILLYTNLFPNSENPNYGIFVYRRAQELSRIAGHSVHVIAPVPYFPRWLRIPRRLQAIPRLSRWLRMSRIPSKEMYGQLNVYHPRYFLVPAISAPFHGFLMFLGSLFLVRRLHAKLQFDCIDGHFVYPDGFAAILIGKLLRLPVAVTAHGTDLNVYPQSLFLRPLIRWTLSRADRVICVSRALRAIVSRLREANYGAVMIPNGVDLNSFCPIDRGAARLALGLSPLAEIIVAVAQLIPRKGHQSLIQAVAKLRKEFPRLQVFIIGEGYLEEVLRREISALDVERHVFLKGPIKNNELFRWYSAADVTCLPSSGEGMPCALLESLACGTPVVATAVGGTPELIDSEELGVLVQQDVFSISRGLAKALRTTWSRTALTSRTRGYTWTRTTLEIEKVLADLVKLNQSGQHGINTTKPIKPYVADITL